MAQTTYQSVLEDIVGVIGQHVTDIAVSEGSRFDSDLALTSIEVMDVVADIEDHFNINIPLNRLPEMQTVGDTAKQLTAMMAEHGSHSTPNNAL